MHCFKYFGDKILMKQYHQQFFLNALFFRSIGFFLCYGNLFCLLVIFLIICLKLFDIFCIGGDSYLMVIFKKIFVLNLKFYFIFLILKSYFIFQLKTWTWK